MQKDRKLPRWTVALALGALAGLTFSPTAEARPDNAHLLQHNAYSILGCPLERIDDQLIRCDNLTGDGVPAPWGVPTA